MANPFTYLELHSTDAKGRPPAGLMPQQEPGDRSAWLETAAAAER